MSNHQWCRDVPRDEAVRAAEDAAAVPAIQHRDLPEQVALLWASLGDIIGRVVRLEGEMDAGQDEEAAPAVCDSVPPANGLRTERVTPPWQRAKWDEALTIICDGGDWGRGNNFDHGVLGALVIWANKEMDRLTAERDAAKKECERLRAERDDALLVLPACCGRLSDAAATVVQERDHARSRVSELLKDCETYGRAVLSLQGQLDLANARVAELEGAAAPAANAGGVSNPGDVSGDGKSNCQGTLDGSQEPVAWGVLMTPGSKVWRCSSEKQAQKCVDHFGTGTVVPLYAAQQPPRGWLTADERELIAGLADDDVFTEEGQNIAKALIARETPPRVNVPNLLQQNTWQSRDSQWIAAIREAGGEVEG